MEPAHQPARGTVDGVSVAAGAPADRRAVQARLRRAAGQLTGVVAMIEAGRDCEDVVRQLAAVSKAVNSAAYLMVYASLRQCLMDGRADSDEVQARLQKVLLSLA